MGSGERFDFGKTNYIKNKDLKQIVNEKYDIDMQLKNKAPIMIPKDVKGVYQEKDSYQQVKYIWERNDIKYEVRWHTPTKNSVEEKPTWQVLRITKGIGFGNNVRPKKQEILIVNAKGEKVWIDKSIWQKALANRKKGIITEKEREILNYGHIKYD